jgi:hypothetical protein
LLAEMVEQSAAVFATAGPVPPQAADIAHAQMTVMSFMRGDASSQV